jgi:alkylation response protein AidB-like acyl-CoA dehydrogenase
MVRVFRDCGRIDLELRDLPGGAHARFLSLAPGRKFDPLLRSVANGSSYCAVAITEPDVGSDLHALTTKATVTETGYRLDGVKQHISRIEECTHFIVFASVLREGQPLVTAFLLSRDTPGVSLEHMSPMGMSSVSWGRVLLAGVEVDASQRIGGEGQAISLFVRHFSYWRTMMAAAAIGCAQGAMDLATERLKNRHAFGGPIGRFSHLQQGLAEMVARLRMAWLLVESVAREFENRNWPIFDAAMAKAEGLEAAIAATDWAMRVHGAAGYEATTGIEKRYRDLLGLRVADGTTDVLRGQVARSILGEDLYEMSLNRGGTPGAILTDARRKFW